VLDFVIVVLVLVLLAMFVSVPLRHQRTSSQRELERALQAERELQDLEAARESKYREIRDAELDRSTGKLSDADWEAVDRTLRGEAIEILRALDKATEALKRRRADADAE
jgi:predicted Holliday junction resolvase-like endonuclease